MKFYANLYPVTTFYTNLPTIMLSLKFYAFLFSMLPGRPERVMFSQKPDYRA